MPSRRILSNNNLAPIQEAAVNPYNSFNSDSVNKLTRIVSGGKDHDVVVDGLDVSSNDIKKWIDSGNLTPTIVEGQSNKFDDSCGWNGVDYYVGKFDGGVNEYIDLCIPHEKSYGFSYVSCKLDDSWLQCYYGKGDTDTGSSVEREFEVTFDLTFGTPKSIVAEINSSRAVLDHPEAGRSYTLKISRNFIRDNKEDGLTFRIGAVLDGADPDESLGRDDETNKTYIRITNIQVKLYGFAREPFPRAIGPVNGVYGLSGIHPVKTLKVTPGLAIKDDVMLEELGIDKYDKDKIVELDPTDPTNWIKNNPYQKNDFGTGTQYVYQLNNTKNGYIRRNASFDADGHLKVTINGQTFETVDDLQVVTGDTEIRFSSFTEDEDNNVTFNYTGQNTITNGGNICLLCYRNTSNELVVAEIINNLTLTNGKLDNFSITLKNDKISKKIQSVNDVVGYITNGPIKVSGDPQLYNTDLVKWAYVVIYYSYFKNPQPNVSYIGLVREEDLNDVKFREDYLILAKVRFIDPYTIDIISYENRQRKWLPRSDKINYSTTCNYPEIWWNDVPDTVTDAIDYIAKFDVNLARLIRYKHDYDAEISSAFNLITENEVTVNGKKKKPFVGINNYSHLERRIRVNTDKIVVDTVYNGNTDLVGKEFTWNSSKKIYFNNALNWAITFDKDIIDNAQEYEYFTLGGEVLVRATMGPYDSSTDTITNRYICFNSIGPFKFIDKDSGSDAVKLNWKYEDILLYPTSPSMSKTDGKYNDTDDGGWTSGYYGGTHTSTNNYLLSYTTAEGSVTTSLNTDKNHFHFFKFRNELLQSDRFLKLLDMMPRDPEVLFDKRVLEGQKSSNAVDQVHIQSSQHQLDDDMVDYNLTMSVRDDSKPTAKDINGTDKIASTVTNHIKSSKFTIAGANNANSVTPVKCMDVNDPSYRTFNKNLKDTAVLTSVDITPSGGKDRIEIKSTDMHLAATGGNKILVSNENDTTDLFDITSSQFTTGDFFGYWFKPKFSYNTESQKLRITIDGSKNYLTRVSDIINEFAKNKPETALASITRVKKYNDTTVQYFYTPTADSTGVTNKVKEGMLVYTEGEATTPYVSNQITRDIDHFAKIPAGNSNTLKVFNSEYENIDENLSGSNKYLYIEPLKESTLYANISNVSVNKSSKTITFTVGTFNIDGFLTSEGMGIYTSGLSCNIYKYNSCVIDNIDGNIITATVSDEFIDRLGSATTITSNNGKIFFICDSDHRGVMPNFNIKGVSNVSSGEVVFEVDPQNQKYISSMAVGNTLFINVTSTAEGDSSYNVDQTEPKPITNIQYATGDNNSITAITVSGFNLPDSDIQRTITAKAYVNSEITGVYTDYKNKKLSYLVSEIKKVDNRKLKVTVIKFSNNQTDYITSDIDAGNFYLTCDLDDIDYTGTNEPGIQVSHSKFSIYNALVTKKTGGNISDGLSQVYRSDEEGHNTIYANYSEITITWDTDIDDSDLTKINGTYYAYKYQLYVNTQEGGASADLCYRYGINKVENGIYYLNGTISASLNDSIVYTDSMDVVKYSDEIGVNNPQVVESVGTENNQDYFTVSKLNSYDLVPAVGSFKANARNITLNEIVSESASDTSSPRINADVVIDITNIKNKELVEESRDAYSTLERYFKSKLVVINDLIDQMEDDVAVKPYVSLTFSILDGDEIIDDSSLSNPTKIIWRDEYRGYNNTKNEEDEFSRMVLYPVQVETNATGGNGELVNITKEYEGSGSAIDKLAGYGYYRGPIFDILAGIRSEFDFQYLKTQSKIKTEGDVVKLDDVDISTINLNNETKLSDVLSFKDLPDIIYAKSSMYYIGNTASSEDTNTIQITYNPNGGTFDSTGNSKSRSRSIQNPTSATKYPDINDTLTYTKRTFSGWYYNNELITLGVTTLKKLTSHTIIAKWTLDPLQVKFYDRGTLKLSKSMTYVNSTTGGWNTLSSGGITFPVVTRDGYSLTWSYKDTNGNYYPASISDSYNDNGYKPYVVDDVLNIYAVWTEASLTVTLNANGGKFSDGTTNNKSIGYSYNQLYGNLDRGLTKVGYDFIGWKHSLTGEMIHDCDSVGISSHELQAQWSPKILVNTFFKNNEECTQTEPAAKLIQFGSNYGLTVSNDGRFGNYNTVYGNYNNFASGSLPSLNNFSSETADYAFNGWSLRPESNVAINNNSIVSIPFSHPLFANWIKTENQDEQDDDPPQPPTGDWQPVEGSKEITVHAYWNPGAGSVRYFRDGDNHNCGTYRSNNKTYTYTNELYPGKTFYLVKIFPGRDMRNMSSISNYKYLDIPMYQYLGHKFEYWYLATDAIKLASNTAIQNATKKIESTITPYTGVQNPDDIDANYVLDWVYISTEYSYMVKNEIGKYVPWFYFGAIYSD